MATELKLIRIRHDQKGIDVAHNANINPSILAKLENRKIHSCPAWRKRLSEYYKVPESQLFDTAGWAKEAKQC